MPKCTADIIFSNGVGALISSEPH